MDSSDDDEPESLQYKVILLGDGTVGKTSISMRFTDDEFHKRRVCDPFASRSDVRATLGNFWCFPVSESKMKVARLTSKSVPAATSKRLELISSSSVLLFRRT